MQQRIIQTSFINIIDIRKAPNKLQRIIQTRKVTKFNLESFLKLVEQMDNSWSILIQFVTREGDEQLDDIPECDEGEANEETKGAAEVWDKGVKGVDEVFPQHGGAQGSKGEDDPKGVEVPQIRGNNPVLVIGAYQWHTAS